MEPPTGTGLSYGVIDRYLGEQGQEYFAWQGVDGPLRAEFNKHLWQPHISPDDDVLDFGCGAGYLLKALEARRKVGIEVNPHARARARELGIEVYPAVADAPGRFTRIISSHALEHVPHPRQALLELREKLADAASRLLLLLPIDDWRARSQRRYDPSDINMHLYTWTPQLLGNLLRSCGLRVYDVRIVPHAWPPAGARLWRTSPRLFHSAAFAWSLLRRQRQLFAVAGLE